MQNCMKMQKEPNVCMLIEVLDGKKRNNGEEMTQIRRT